MIKNSWITLANKDTIDGMSYNIASPELFPSPKFVEIIHNGNKYFINSIFIQYVPDSKIEFSNRRLV